MQLRHLVLPAALSMALSNPVFAAADAARFVLTPSLVQKIQAAQTELNELQDGDKAADSVEALVSAFDKNANAKAVLTRHALSSREAAFASVALRQARVYVEMEKLMEKRKAEMLFASFTAQQRANIAVLRGLTAG